MGDVPSHTHTHLVLTKSRASPTLASQKSQSGVPRQDSRSRAHHLPRSEISTDDSFQRPATSPGPSRSALVLARLGVQDTCGSSNLNRRRNQTRVFIAGLVSKARSSCARNPGPIWIPGLMHSGVPSPDCIGNMGVPLCRRTEAKTRGHSGTSHGIMVRGEPHRVGAATPAW